MTHLITFQNHIGFFPYSILHLSFFCTTILHFPFFFFFLGNILTNIIIMVSKEILLIFHHILLIPIVFFSFTNVVSRSKYILYPHIISHCPSGGCCFTFSYHSKSFYKCSTILKISFYYTDFRFYPYLTLNLVSLIFYSHSICQS